MNLIARSKVAFASNELTDILVDGSDLYSSDDGFMSKEFWQNKVMSQLDEQHHTNEAIADYALT